MNGDRSGAARAGLPGWALAVIQQAVWLHLRFTLSYRDVEDLLAERGVDVSYETIRRWVLKFGLLYARNLRSQAHEEARLLRRVCS